MPDKETVMNTLKCGADLYPRVLEQRFPHVLTKLLLLWGSAEAEVYITDLLQPNGRSGGRLDRDGFPTEVTAEIFKLGVLHRKFFSGGR